MCIINNNSCAKLNFNIFTGIFFQCEVFTDKLISITSLFHLPFLEIIKIKLFRL